MKVHSKTALAEGPSRDFFFFFCLGLESNIEKYTYNIYVSFSLLSYIVFISTVRKRFQSGSTIYKLVESLFSTPYIDET